MEKNLIKDYLDKLPAKERLQAYKIRAKIMDDGYIGLKSLPRKMTRQLGGKLWEIKFLKNRIMYVIRDEENIYFLHACKKQKGKAEKFELEKARKRAQELDLVL